MLRRSALLIAFVLMMNVHSEATAQVSNSGTRIGIAVQGGAGTIVREQMTAELEQEYTAKLTEAISAGYGVLRLGGNSLDAVEAVIRILEDSPLFNAGKGAVFTHEGTNELDASIMDGATLRAGAVAGVRHIKNPISLARMVMERSPHVLLTGEGAEAFAKEQHVDLVDEKYFYTEKRWNQLQHALELERTNKDSVKGFHMNAIPVPGEDGRHGTVGCVALDQFGNLAAGTSTGGITNKRSGRVGDSPIVGAGTYANNATCAVSATGDGEYFIRSVVAHDISALMEYRKLGVGQAADEVIGKVGKLQGSGGVVAIDREGNIAMPFNTSGMYRAYIDAGGKPIVKIYKE